MSFSFENLDVYKKALDLVEDVEIICRQLKGKVAYPLLDQLTRAVLSVPLNIAEGNGRWHKNDKKRFFWIARGSVFEIVPIFQIFLRRRVITDEDYRGLYERSATLSKMLLGLISSVDDLRHN